MKRIWVIAVLILTAVMCYAQKDVTKFLGFPVDGTKDEMIKNLKSKGFKVDRYKDMEFLKGRFNGSDVEVFISTENGKVARIMVSDENHLDVTSIRIRFNNLCRQFEENDKYYSLEDFSIPEDENIAYNIKIKNKRYEAIFYQLPEGETFEQFQSAIMMEVANKYSLEELEHITDDKREEFASEVVDRMINYLKNKLVWFIISEFRGEYYITMYYDNEYNRANGEDL